MQFVYPLSGSLKPPAFPIPGFQAATEWAHHFHVERHHCIKVESWMAGDD
jgi:hypothetical protein